MRRWARRAGLVAFQVVAPLVLLEIVLRLLVPYHDGLRVLLYLPTIRTEFDRIETVEELLNHSVIGYRPHRVHSGFVLNSKGFRTREYSTSKPPGTWRVVALGDSFTFASGGLPYSDLWVSVLEGELERAGRRPVEAIALGVPGVGPSFLRRLWQLEGSRLDADTAILALFVGNDFTDQAPAVVRDAGAGLARLSLVARLARNLVRLRRANVVLPEDPDAAAGGPAGRGGYEVPGYREAFARKPPKMSRDALMDMEARRAVICDLAETAAFEALARKTTRVLAALHDEVRAAGVDFLVVIIPDRFQVLPADRAEVLDRLGRGDDEFDWERPQRTLAAFFEREEIDYLDLLPEFRSAVDRDALYNPADAHWSAAGNRLAARLLRDHLASRPAGPIPAAPD